jgi:hypothetical protein
VIIFAKVLQSVEEEDELVKDENATEHEIVQDNNKKGLDEWVWQGKPSLFQNVKVLRTVTGVGTNCHW